MPLKELFGRYRFLVLSLGALCVLCGSTNAQEFKALKPGVEYAEVTKEISGKQVQMNLLRLDLTKVRLDVHHAMDAAIGTEKTSSIATRHGAFAAINAGFFRLDTSIFAGDAAGILKINGKAFSESASNRSAAFISNRPDRSLVEFSQITTHWTLRAGTKNYSILGVNRERKANETVIFTPEFHRTTLSSCDGTEIVVRRNRVLSIRDSCGTIIPVDGFVISTSGQQRELLLKSPIRRGSRVSLIEKIVTLANDPSPMELQRVKRLRKIYKVSQHVTNGVPQLIKNSKIDITWEQEKTTKSFVETRHPRTAVAKLKGGKFLMITVDGRSEVSGGIGLQDLAEYLLSLGATDAMNLDGGGSTTMYVDGKVVNRPSDKEGERKVSDAILVTLRKK